MSLVYPLGSPVSTTFDHIDLKSITYQQLQHNLEMKYAPTSTFVNTEKREKEVLYRSKHIANRSNYFFSTFMPEEKCFVWRSVNCFLQMRPSQVPEGEPEKEQPKSKGGSNLDKQIEDMMIKRDGGRIMERRMKSYAYVEEMHRTEPKK